MLKIDTVIAIIGELCIDIFFITRIMQHRYRDSVSNRGITWTLKRSITAKN